MSATLASGYDLVILDLDGVVYVGDRGVPGAAEAIEATVDGGTPVAYVTNNASRRADEVAALLRSLTVRADAGEVLTSGQAAASVLAGDLPAAAPVLVVGAPALRAEIRDAGLTPVGAASERPVAVVQGYGPRVGWSDLAEACLAIRAGARWVATNTDATLPSPRGTLPGNGSLVAALSTALGGRTPDIVVGKPSPTLFEMAAHSRGAGRALVVGDRIDTDIGGANMAGMDSLLVLTGVSTVADVIGAAAHERPTYVGADCRALSTPAGAARVPRWDGENDVARAGGWLVTRDADRLVLGEETPGAARTGAATIGDGTIGDGTIGDRTVGDGTAGELGAVDAARALAAAAWAYPHWTVVAAATDAAMRAIDALGLARCAGWPVSPASGA